MMASFWHRGLAACALLAASWPSLGMDYHLAPAGTPAPPSQ